MFNLLLFSPILRAVFLYYCRFSLLAGPDWYKATLNSQDSQFPSSFSPPINLECPIPTMSITNTTTARYFWDPQSVLYRLTKKNTPGDTSLVLTNVGSIKQQGPTLSWGLPLDLHIIKALENSMAKHIRSSVLSHSRKTATMLES